MTLRRLAILLLPLMLLAACGDDDDGADVRNIGGEGSGSASASASGSGSGSHPASGSGSASAPHDEDHEECVEELADPQPGTVVEVDLTEFAVAAVPARAAAGEVGFVARNAGAAPHELAVVRAESADAIPTAEGGAADLDALGDDVIGEIEPFEGGKTCAAAFDLEPGTYVLLCNVDDHFAQGMHTEFTVAG
jgi:uncharacterized cupredoxin-like copper-binding protein